jgi:peptide/nickel transport system substrate-binding protein
MVQKQTTSTVVIWRVSFLAFRRRGGKRRPMRSSFCCLLGLTISCVPEAPAERPTTTLSVLLKSAPESLDPRRGSSAVELRVQELMFRGLVHVRDDLSSENDLAERITIDAAQHITVTLKPNQWFHTCYDGTSGGQLKASDVRFTYESLRDPKVRSKKQRILADIASIEVPDPEGLTVIFHLRKPLANWLSDNGQLGIVPEACAAKDPDAFARNPSGTGALRFEKREGDRRLWLQRFDPSLAFKRMELRVVSDETTRLLELMKGRSDVLTETPARPLLSALKRDQSLRLLAANGNGYSYIAFNLRKPELAQLKVRQAIDAAIDRAAIINHKYLGMARPSNGMMPPGHWAHAGDLVPNKHDPRRAANLLAEAGWRTVAGLLDSPKGNDERPVLRLELRTTPDKFGRALALVLQHQLAAVGIDLQLRINDWGTLYSQVKKGNFQLVRMEWVPVLSPDLLDWVFHSDSIPDTGGRCTQVADCPGEVIDNPKETSRRYRCSDGRCKRSGGNRGGYVSEKVDGFLHSAATTQDRETRRRIYNAAQKELAADLPYVSLWHEDRVWVVRTPWDGIQLKASGSLRGLLGAHRKATQP